MKFDLNICIEELRQYKEEGVQPQQSSSQEESCILREVSSESFYNIEPSEPDAKFLSVDASSYPLMRSNNWRMGVSRCAYVIVEKSNGHWSATGEGCEDHFFVTIAPTHQRPFKIWSKLREYESKIASEQIDRLDAGDFCLMDGAAFFGGAREYSFSLYDACRNRDVKLLMIPKNSPSLHDAQGRDLLTAIGLSASELQRAGGLGGCWIYHPIWEAKRMKDLYGDISCVKLSPTSSRVFRCDVIDYLVHKGDRGRMIAAISELASLSRDARCDGYPAPLFLAHQQTSIPEAKLMEYLEQVRLRLDEEGLLSFLEREAENSNFRKQLLGLKHDYQIIEGIEV
jgi:hypothetical protein